MFLKKIVFIAIFIFLFVHYSLGQENKVPKRPSNIPQNSVWQYNRWKYKDMKNHIIYGWYRDGSIERKGHFITKGSKEISHGLCIFWSPEGRKIMEENWVEGKLQKRKNYFIEFAGLQRPSNIPKNAKWDQKKKNWRIIDKRKQVFLAWYINGEKKVLIELKGSKFNGKLITWYQNGFLEKEAFYKNNKTNGVVTVYSKLGKIKYKLFYKNDVVIWRYDFQKIPPPNVPVGVVWDIDAEGWAKRTSNTVTVYYNSGAVKFKYEMSNNDYNGKHSACFESGTIAIDGKFKNSLREGTWIIYSRDGKIIRKQIYKNGKILKVIKSK